MSSPDRHGQSFYEDRAVLAADMDPRAIHEGLVQEHAIGGWRGFAVHYVVGSRNIVTQSCEHASRCHRITNLGSRRRRRVPNRASSP